MSAINIIQKVARKLLTQGQPKGVITIPNRMTAEAKAGEIAATLQRAGLSMDRFDEFITSETDLIRLLNQIEAFEKKNLAESIQSGIRNTQSAKVFDLKGKEIPPGSKIMGGQAVENQKRFFKGVEIKDPTFDENLPFDNDAEKLAEIKMSNEAYEQIPPGNRGGPDDIAAPVQSSEETLKNMIIAENKKNIAKIKNRKMIEEAIDNVSVGFSGDRRTDAELVAAEIAKRRGLNVDDLDIRQRAGIYGEAYEALTDFLRRDKADGGRIGFFLGSPPFRTKGLATLREMVKFFSKGKEKERSGSEILKLVNPKQFNRLLEDPSIYRKFDMEKGIGAPELIKNMQGEMTKNRAMMVEEILSAAKNIRQSDISTIERKKEIVEEMMRRGIDRETAEGMADTLATMAESAAGKLDTPKLTDEGILQLENILKDMQTGGKKKRELNADGGRIGFKDGPKITRRTFLKYLAGLASIPIIGKVIKPLKLTKGVTKVPIIKTSDVPGKPEWFDQLVNKVILEGDDVTKKFATQERQVVHMKKIDDETSVMVTQDLNDGSIMVDVDDPIRNVMGEQGDTKVQMMLKKGQADETTKGTPADDFSFTENDMRNYMDGPDDYTTEFTENTVNKMKDLTSDLGKIESYATGKKQTMKQIVESKKRKDKVRFAEEKPAEYAAERGPEVDYDPEPDFASGGIARMLGE